MKTVIAPTQPLNFVETEYIKDISRRGLSYTEAGLPVHFSGPAGVGKTTLAMHLASLIGRPIVLIHGDEELKTSDLVGGNHGYRFKRHIDKFVPRVSKFEESMVRQWVDNRLTIACKNGFTLIYDEFTRSRPEANNVLLHVLSEKILNLPAAGDEGESFVKVHPNFTAIFTSNQKEYVGVHPSQDALMDRLITITLDSFDYETEIAITQAKSDLSKLDAQAIVNVIRDLKRSGNCELGSSIRSCIKIARILKLQDIFPMSANKNLGHVFEDVLISESVRHGSKLSLTELRKMIGALVQEYIRMVSPTNVATKRASV